MKLNKIILAALFSLLALSCVREDEAVFSETGDFALLIRPVIASPATKVDVPSVQSLQEDVVDSLNVYFYGTFKGDASPSLKHYFLKSDTDKTGATSWQVSSDWRADGFVPGSTYDVYVSANSRHVKVASETTGSYLHTATGKLSDATVTDLGDLKSMIEFDYDPSAENGEGGHKPYWGTYDEDNLNPGWLNLHKKYTSESFDFMHRYYTVDKKFLMDGTTTFTAGSSDVIPLELVRAASKVVVDVKFDTAFLASLGTKNVALSGAPAWKFFNFSFSTPVFDPSSIAGAAPSYNKSIFTAGAIIMGSLSGASSGFSDNDLVYSSDADRHFSFATYTYPFSWSASGASSEAPAIILSLGYEDTTDPGNPTISYQVYKIPVVDPDSGVTELGRNKLYRISATIASEGGELMTDAFKVRCDYDVIPWGDIPVDAEDIAQVDHSDNDYLDVTPTDLVLNGDGLQTGVLSVIKPNKRNIKLKYFDVVSAVQEDPYRVSGSDVLTEYSFDGNNVAENAPAPYYFNYNGVKRKVFDGEKSKGGVVYANSSWIQNRFTRSNNALELSSYSLPNGGVKYMKVRVYLDVTDWESKGLYRDITIRHFPSNYIYAKTGSWASRTSALSFLPTSNENYVAWSEDMRGPEEMVMDYTLSYDRAEYLTWSEDDRMEYGFASCTQAQYNDGKSGSYPDDYRLMDAAATNTEYLSNYASNPLYRREGYEEHTRCFHNDPTASNGIKTNGSRANNKQQNTGEANAFKYDTDGYYYWGTDPVEIGTVQKTVTAGYSATVTENNFDIPNIDGTWDYYVPGSAVRGSRVGLNYNYTMTFTFYRYEHHYRSKYIKPDYQRMSFVNGGFVKNTSLISNIPARDYRWVNWAVHQGQSMSTTVESRTYRVNSQANNTNNAMAYFARVYDNANSVSKRITTDGAMGDSQSRSNNHMYIVMTSEPNTSIVLGRPNMDNRGFSYDKVISPAFMLASQVGSIQNDIGISSGISTTVQNFGTVYVRTNIEYQHWMARHCATYLEVGSDGTYYKNWRLPTEDEIRMLIDNQQTTVNGFQITGDDRIIDLVLGSGYYMAADRVSVPTGTGNTAKAVRCVRDLTQEEIDAFNN